MSKKKYLVVIDSEHDPVNTLAEAIKNADSYRGEGYTVEVYEVSKKWEDAAPPPPQMKEVPL
jgi:hypothetical protein